MNVRRWTLLLGLLLGCSGDCGGTSASVEQLAAPEPAVPSAPAQPVAPVEAAAEGTSEPAVPAQPADSADLAPDTAQPSAAPTRPPAKSVDKNAASTAAAGQKRPATAQPASSAKPTAGPTQPGKPVAPAAQATATSPAPPEPAQPTPTTPAATPAPAAKAPVNVPRTPHVRIEFSAAVQKLLNADSRMQPWVKNVVAVVDRCYAKQLVKVGGAIVATITMHENARPDADIDSLPPTLAGVVACATGDLMRTRMPLFTGPEGQRHQLKIHFAP